MDNIKVRKVTSSDLQQLEFISKKTFSDTFSASNTKEDMMMYLDGAFNSNQLAIEINNPGCEFYFATLGDEVIGYVKINTGQAQTELKHENSLEIERIYVVEEFLGKKVGQLLYNRAIELAKIKKVDFVWLGVWERNKRAIDFYKKNGFVEFDKHIFKLGNDEQTDLMMKLSFQY